MSGLLEPATWDPRRAAFSLPRPAYGSDLKFHTLSREAKLCHTEQRASGCERRSDDRGSESSPDIGQESLAIADDIDHGANHIVRPGPGRSKCGEGVLGDLVDMGANIVDPTRSPLAASGHCPARKIHLPASAIVTWW
jgi:hypothetical protein